MRPRKIMRTLPTDDVSRFYRLHWQLLAYVNRRFNLVAGLRALHDFQAGVIPNDVDPLRKKLYSQPGIIQAYAEENPDKLAVGDLGLVRSWQRFVADTFYVVRFFKNYTAFFQSGTESLAYAVKALYSDLPETLGTDNAGLPVLLDAVLLPWREHIIYDGVFDVRPITFGRSITRDIHRAYQETKAQRGLIASLPYTPRQPSEEQRLKSYLRTEASRIEHHEKIWELIKKSPMLRTLYHQETGKAAARRLGRELRQRSVKPGWFAVYREMIIASGTTEQEAQAAAKKVAPEHDQQCVYVFQLRSPEE